MVTRAKKVSYHQFRASALDALVAERNKSKSAEQAREAVSQAYPEFRSLTKAQVKRLIRAHVVSTQGQNHYVDTVRKEFKETLPHVKEVTTAETEAAFIAWIGRAKTSLDNDAFTRVMEYGMYLLGKN